MFNFDFLGKGLEVVSPPHFVYDFSRKMFLILYYINWPNFIVWLSLGHEILDNVYIAISCFPGCDIINFESNFLSNQAFFLHDQKVETKTETSWEQKRFGVKQKPFLIIFKGVSVAKKLSQTWECAFTFNRVNRKTTKHSAHF